MIVGSGEYQYQVNAEWEQLPADLSHPDVCSVAVDSADRVYLLTRNEPFVLVYERDGRFIEAWDAKFVAPHHMSIGPGDWVLITDYKNHTVHKYTRSGELVMTLGTPGVKTETGSVGRNLFTVRRAGPPFNEPTNAVLGRDDKIFVSDGYFNARVHRFSADGELEISWGEPGGDAGEFYTPHSLAVDGDGNVWVADRENDRIQVFTPDGTYIRQLTDMYRPDDLVFGPDGSLFVAELGRTFARYPWMPPPSEGIPPPYLSIFSPDGTLLARWGTLDYAEPGSFLGLHGLAVDSHGDIYTSEANKTAQRTGEIVAGPNIRTVQKFERIGPG